MSRYLSLLALTILCLACQHNTPAPSTAATTPETSPELPKPKKEIKAIGILLYDGYTTLDAMGPYQVLSELMGTKVFFIAKEKGLVKSGSGMAVMVEHDIASVDSLDILLIPGGFKETYLLQQDKALLSWVGKIDQTTTFTTSVCTGAWVLAATGLLKGKNATTHWYGKKILRDMGVIVLDQRWVQDGKYWTSAGVSAGMDMCFALINEVMGEKYTKTAMLDLEYDPQPPFKAGSEQNTSPEIVAMMRQMYDAGLEQVQKAPKQTQTPKQTQKTAPPIAKEGFANKVDFICGMEVTPDYTDTCRYKGKLYGFCSEYCKDKFLENPLKYLGTGDR